MEDGANRARALLSPNREISEDEKIELLVYISELEAAKRHANSTLRNIRNFVESGLDDTA